MDLDATEGRATEAELGEREPAATTSRPRRRSKADGEDRPVVDRLLDGTGIRAERFVRELYPCQAVEMHGDPRRLGDLLAAPLWDDPAALIRASVEDPRPTVYTFDPKRGRSRQERMSPGEAADAFARGASVSIEAGDLVHPLVAAWSTSLAGELGVALEEAKAAVIVSAPGPAVPVHLDGIEVLVVQLRGTKVWQYARNEELEHVDTPFFRDEGGAGKRGRSGPPLYDVRALASDLPPMRETTLRPGSALFLPRGWWHGTSCDEISISITFRLPNRALYRIIADAIARRLATQARWRRPVPGIASDAGWRAEAASFLASIMPELAQDLDLTEAGTAKLVAGLGGALVQPSSSHRIAVGRATRDLTVFAGDTAVRRLRLGTEVFEIACWLAEQTSPFRERDALHAVPNSSPAATGAILRWLVSAGALTSDGELTIGQGD